MTILNTLGATVEAKIKKFAVSKMDEGEPVLEFALKSRKTEVNIVNLNRMEGQTLILFCPQGELFENIPGESLREIAYKLPPEHYPPSLTEEVDLRPILFGYFHNHLFKDDMKLAIIEQRSGGMEVISGDEFIFIDRWLEKGMSEMERKQAKAENPFDGDEHLSQFDKDEGEE